MLAMGLFDVTMPEPTFPTWTWTAPNTAPAAVVQRCPICEGRGTVPRGFRMAREHPTRRARCKPCAGRGMLLVTAIGTVTQVPSWQLV